MANRLAQEKSPYLLQHADNPVDWHPWGEEAFALARSEQKPIFLSIGYSTCHWCHVMAHESFEDAEIAAFLNEHFVSIKVDREERPDVDRIYMTYVQAMTGHGGWPLSAWLTPELKPFFGGTYFPAKDSHGRSGFLTVLQSLTAAWARDRDKLVAEGDRVIDALRTHFSTIAAKSGEAGQSDLTERAEAAFESCFEHLSESFDPGRGGFGGAPKFPRASNLNFLFRVAAMQKPDSPTGKEAIAMASATLQKMAEGGIHDHVGGGFHRYSVDDEWFVPHFEKMLYDQAQIAVNYLDARQATGREIYAWLARDIFGYVLRDLTSSGGAFYSAEDADSTPPEQVSQPEKQHAREGAFYLWTKAELQTVLGEDAEFFCAHFGVKESGNVEPERDPHGDFEGKNILMQRQPLVETARAAGLDLESTSERLTAALEKLRVHRAQRPRPHLDDKIITAWNGLMISALARGAQVLGDAALADAAVRAAGFLQRELYDERRGILFRSYRNGRGNTEGFAEDYAFLIQGLLDLYEAVFDVRWLQWAERLQQTMDTLFWDGERGGYFSSAAKDATLVLRLKEDYDGAEPAPGSVAAMNLSRLSVVTGETSGFRERAQAALEASSPHWTRAPQMLPQTLCALELALSPPRQVVLAGDPHAGDFQQLAAVLHEKIGPLRTILAADGAQGQRWLAAKAPWLAEMKPLGGRATAYVCEHFTCRQPVTGAEELRALLR